MIAWFNATFKDKFAEDTKEERQPDYEEMLYFDKELVEAPEEALAERLKDRQTVSTKKKENVYRMQTEGTGETCRRIKAKKITSRIANVYINANEDKKKQVNNY